MDKTWNLTFEHMKIVVLDGYGLNPGDLSWEEMRALGELTVYDRTAPAELLERSAGAEVLITNKTVITAEDMAALPALKYIGVLATGYNIVDILHTGSDRTQCIKRSFQLVGYDLRQRGLPHPRRPPEDKGGDASRVDHLAQDSPRPHQVFLTYIIVQCLRTQTFC
jgi:hypothetical protein